MDFYSRLRTLAAATFTRIRGNTHQERLEAYYRPQANAYDGFREHLLHGRRQLLDALPVKKGDRLVELGAGTGWIAEALGERLAWCESYTMVDLCRPLMAQARLRSERLGWSNVTIVEADAAEFMPAHPVDIVLCSYCLTMMPRWFAVIDRAHQMLRPGGVFGATDFYVSQPNPEPGLQRHSAWQRWFWPACFAWHHVWLNADHVPYLRHRFEHLRFSEHSGRMPFMAGLRAPYYVFLGCKPLVGEENCPH
jgi:S-adenosylmethionine-diacylgycerolhomoserine-N-methlytransferase